MMSMGAMGVFLKGLAMFEVFELGFLGYPATGIAIIPSWLVLPFVAILAIGANAIVTFAAATTVTAAAAVGVSTPTFVTGFFGIPFATHTLHSVCPMAFLTSKLHSYLPGWIVWCPAMGCGIVTKYGYVMWIQVHSMHSLALFQAVHTFIILCPFPEVIFLNVVVSMRIEIFLITVVTTTIITS
jgi:hypothetical protein